MKRASVRTITLLFGIGLLLTFAGLFVSYVLIPVLSPFASARIPQWCIDTQNRRDAAAPIVLATDARAKLVLVGKTLLAIRKSDKVVVRRLQLQNTIVAAALHDGTAYVFGNNAIGFFFNETTGDPVRNLIETDNYREPYTSNGATYVQTDFEMSALQANWHVVSHLRLKFRTVVYGCHIS
jgi:hypothetical protein